MNTKEFAEKLIRYGMKYADENTSHHRGQFEAEDVDGIASSQSVGLITLTEERLKQIIIDVYEEGQGDEEWRDVENSDDYASRIIEALGKER